jgi:ABC-type Fe3+-siderophore transport system permease subunit
MEHTEPKPRLSDLAQEQILYRIRTGELPVGSLTSMVGAPMFIYLLYKNKKTF